MTPEVIENAKLKLVLEIPIGAPITVANEARDIPPLVADKTNQGLIRIVKGRDTSIKSFAHYFYFVNFSNKIFFDLCLIT